MQGTEHIRKSHSSLGSHAGFMLDKRRNTRQIAEGNKHTSSATRIEIEPWDLRPLEQCLGKDRELSVSKTSEGGSMLYFV
ncbi:hypothetical protein CONLIGDRAFT_627409 [Coniochaeta ligniaria NRRL 30616]|uniref:Uncharacterized protein n=1 Tax=Coniochaeta ligniaria NRRL 30616 TaxID=1408157 RepID=A0A1J7JYX2_9PEZI|nr:hypothetical protein CONLIGDRAFT_627409 [Coniochaeta ligniaria NRRL 30616]